MLLGYWKASTCKQIPDQSVRIKVHLPVVLVVAVRRYCEDCAQWVKCKNLDVRCWSVSTFGRVVTVCVIVVKLMSDPPRATLLGKWMARCAKSFVVVKQRL